MAGELQKPLLGPENFNRDGIDLEHLPLEEVFQQLKTSQRGLSSEDAEARIHIFGPNKLEENPENKFLKFLSFMWNPLSWVMEAAAVMAIVLANGGGEGPDWQDFVGIVCLLIINSTISFIEENNAGDAAAALMARLAPKAKVLRDGQWQEQDASILVPGDIISIKPGDIIPADARLLEGDPLKIDQSALTGESLLVTKRTGDEVFSGSTCKHGEVEAVVIATGVHSFFGKASHLVDSTECVGHFQQVLTSIGNFCICSIAVGMFLEIIVMFPIQHRSYRKGINNLLVLLIGGIPIAMPTVSSVTLANGSHRLSQQGAIMKRMTAIEEMAGMDVLCSDKTGTLPLTVDRNLIEILNMCQEKHEIAEKVHAIIENFAERGLRSLGVGYQEIPEKNKESRGVYWHFCGLLPIFDPSAETIRKALNLGVCVKMITDPNRKHGKAETFVHELQDTHQRVHHNLLEAATKYKCAADQKRRGVVFEVGDFVWAVLTRDRFSVGEYNKLKSKKVGPYEILERINANAYRLKLPAHLRTSDVFNVKHLLPYVGDSSEEDPGPSSRSNFLHPGGNDARLMLYAT